MKRVSALAVVVSVLLICLPGVHRANAGTYTQTRYPIVLAHGFFGFENLAGFVDYWPGIPSALERDGATVHVMQVSPVNNSIVRGEELIARLDAIRAATGAEKFNLIGHSQGALDIRYVASVRPDLVASITAVAGPTRLDVLDVLDGLPPQWREGLLNIAAYFLQGFGRFMTKLSGYEGALDGRAALGTFDTLDEFNALFPIGLPNSECGEGDAVYTIDGHDIHVYSWGGVGIRTNALDFSDYLMYVASKLTDEPGDGLVPQCASHLGRVIRDDYKHNHADLVNLMWGLVPLDEANPKSVFRIHANRLKNAGL